MALTSKIAKNKLTNPVTQLETTFEDLWKDQRCVIMFFRRWGWRYCRLAAREISAIQPLLHEHNVNLIGIGFEPLGFEMFIRLRYFDGEIFLDQGKQSYKALGFKSMSYLEGVLALLSAVTRAAKETARGLGLISDKVGDMYQNGGCLVVEKGGGNNPLLHFVQKGPADRVSTVEILKILGIGGDVALTRPISDANADDNLPTKI